MAKKIAITYGRAEKVDIYVTHTVVICKKERIEALFSYGIMSNIIPMSHIIMPYKTLGNIRVLNGFYIDKIGISALTIGSTACDYNSIAFFYKTAFNSGLLCKVE